MVQVRNVSKRYGTREVLKNVSFSIKKGEFWVLFGADDAGKTTLLQLMMGYSFPHEGALLLSGSRPDFRKSVQREKIRYVPDDLIRDDNTTGEQFFQYVRNASRRYDVQMQQQLCKYFKLSLKKNLTEMSYQDNKLIQIIAALAARPELLIMDEPMNLLEREVWKRILECVRFYQAKGMAVLTTSVEYEYLEGQCDHYAYLRDGRLITGDVRRDTGRAKCVTAIKGNNRQTCIYRGDVSKLQNVLLPAGVKDWTIEKLTLREELDMLYASQK